MTQNWFPGKKRFLPCSSPRESRQTPKFGWLAILQDQLSHHFSQRGAVLEAVAGAAAQQPHVIHSGMAVHDEVAVGSLLVLADARLDQRSIFHRGKTESNIFADALQGRLTDHSFAEGGIEGAAAGVIGDLEAAAVASWDAVEEAVAVIAPHGKMRVGEAGVAGGGAEEKDILLRGADEAAQSFGGTVCLATGHRRRCSDRL